MNKIIESSEKERIEFYQFLIKSYPRFKNKAFTYSRFCQINSEKHKGWYFRVACEDGYIKETSYSGK